MTQQAAAQALLVCSQCGQTFAQSDLLQIAGNWVCGDCKPAFLSRVMARGTGATSSLRYAGVGIRFGARFIDGLIFLVPFLILGVLVLPNLLRTAGSRATIFNGTFFLAIIISAYFTKC